MNILAFLKSESDQLTLLAMRQARYQGVRGVAQPVFGLEHSAHHGPSIDDRGETRYSRNKNEATAGLLSREVLSYRSRDILHH